MRLGTVLCGTAAVLVPALSVAHDCKCRNRGTMFELGQTACLRVDGEAYLARCEMKLNVSSWTKVQDGCPEAMDGPGVLTLGHGRDDRPMRASAWFSSAI